MSIKGKIVVFSGFRSETLKAAIEKAGGFVKSAISGKTNILIVKSKEDAKAKLQKATEMGIEVLEQDKFNAKYMASKSPSPAAKKVSPEPAPKKASPKPATKKAPAVTKAPAKARLFRSKNEFSSLAETEAEHGKLYHGDVVVFGGDRYENAKILIASPQKRYFVNNPDTTDSGYLTIPEEVSKYYSGNITTFYSKIIKEIEEDFTDIIISNESDIIKDIYGETKTNVREHGKFSYVLDSEDSKFSLQVAFKGAVTKFPKTAKMAAIEKKFSAKEVEYKVKASLSIEGKSSQHIELTLDDDAMKSLFPSKKWSLKSYGASAITKGPESEDKKFIDNILGCKVKFVL